MTYEEFKEKKRKKILVIFRKQKRLMSRGITTKNIIIKLNCGFKAASLEIEKHIILSQPFPKYKSGTYVS